MKMKNINKVLVYSFIGYFVPVGTLAAAINVPITIRYSPMEVQACDPRLKSGSDSDSKKSHVGERVTARATVKLVSDTGYFFDDRPGAIGYQIDGVHVNGPGKPKSYRGRSFLATQITLTSSAHRGRSGRWGRNAKVNVVLNAYLLKKTLKCLESLGLL
jgi:hypothetical protein